MANSQCFIKNPKSGYVLEDRDGKVILQHFTKYPTQKWIKEPAGHGMVYLKNVGTGHVMDVEAEHVITRPRNSDLPQRWHLNCDGTITNCVNGYALDVPECKYEPFKNLIIYPKHGWGNQLFSLTPANNVCIM